MKGQLPPPSAPRGGGGTRIRRQPGRGGRAANTTHWLRGRTGDGVDSDQYTQSGDRGSGGGGEE